MPHKKKAKKQPGVSAGMQQQGPASPSGTAEDQTLEIVLKCDVAGTAEAVKTTLETLRVPSVRVRVIQTGVGHISKSDILMAQTGSRLVVGFSVDVVPKLQSEIMESGVEVRLYNVIYQLTTDVEKIASTLVAKPAEETITGRGDVIAIFKSRGGGTILGCKVTSGVLAVGNRFRVITAMGPAYFGTIESLHIEKDAVKSATPGQQVGLKINDWKKARVGDAVECYLPPPTQSGRTWKPKPGIYRIMQNKPKH